MRVLMKSFSLSITLFLFLLSSIPLTAQEAVTTGPENGSLVIIGGGRTPDTIIERFIELAGGLDAPIVVIPTASGSDNITQNSGGAQALRNFGATNVIVLHTRDPKEADTDAFIEPLKNASGIFFGGGRQWRLVDAYAGTKTEAAFWEVLERGGVIGGSSAGATIQGSYLARGDTRTNQIMMGDHEEGFGFVKNIAIDQHVIARNRHFDMFDILKNRPELLGISVDEGTAAVVQGNQFEVIGDSYVIIFDGTFWSREGSSQKTLPPGNELFYFLRSGDKYDMENRRVIND